MKHTFLTLLFAIVVSTGTSSSAVVGGIGYVFDSDNLTAYVTGLSVKYSGSITIPSSVSYSGKTYKVTGINSAAFQDCSDLTSITIPYSVTSIGRGAFRGCSSLTSMVVAEENIVYDSRSNCNAIIETSSNTLIAGCKNTLIPNSVTEIGNSAFEGCSSLTSIEIPNSVTNIGYQAFYHCTSLTSVTIPNSVTSIGHFAFSGCSGLSSVTIGNSVTSIGAGVFGGCSSLTTPVYNAHVFAYMPSTYSGAYSILDGIESIAGSAFRGCTNLTSINIPNSVTNIGGGAFYGCSSLPIIDNIRYADTYLIEAVDKTCKSYTIKNGTKWIGPDAFMECTNLTSITIPEGVMEIGTAAFYDCHDLASITIPNSVTKIFTETFTGCVSLFATIPNSVVEIDGASFSFVPNVEYSGTATGAPWEARSVNGFVDDLLVYSDESKTQLLACSAAATGDIVIPNSVTNIGYYAFGECSSLTSVTIPNNVTSIGNWAFYECSGLTAIYVPCGEIERFQQLLPPNASLVQYAPYPSYQLTTVAENGNISTSGSAEGLTACDNPPLITCTANPAENYHFAKWSDGNTDNPRIIALASDTTLIAIFDPDMFRIFAVCDQSQGHITGAGSFPYKSSCTIEAVPEYGYHFAKWLDGNTDNPRTFVLTQDTAFSAIFDIDRYGKCGDDLALTWEYDVIAKALTIKGDGTLNSNYAFGLEAPTSVETLTIAEGVTTIGNSAFAGYGTIKQITIPTSVKTIYEQAFYNCTGLRDIYNYRDKPSVAYSNTFDGIDKFECTLHVLSASVDMYKAATGWRDFYYIQTIDAEAVTEPVKDVSVTPSANTADVTWPAVDNAATYELTIKDKNGNVICTLVFNANGQLTSIAFAAPGRGQRTAQVTGFTFTVTGLDSGSSYGFTMEAKDSQGEVLDTKSGTFTTTGGIATGVGNASVDLKPVKVIENGQLFILRDGKTYNVVGATVK